MFKLIYRVKVITYDFEYRNEKIIKYIPQYTISLLKHIIWFNMEKVFYSSFDALAFIHRERRASDQAVVSVNYESVE